MEGFLKGAKLPDHLSPELELRLSALPLHHKKTGFILDCQDDLLNFAEDLEDLQKLEQYLNFDPLVDVPAKLQ